MQLEFIESCVLKDPQTGELISYVVGDVVEFTDTVWAQAIIDAGFAQEYTGGGGGGGGTAGVSSFAGRTGNVTPKKGDYNAAKITLTNGDTVQDALDNIDGLIDLDIALSPTSTKAVQNKVITEKITELESKTIPSGGTSGQLLAKNSNSNYDVGWISGDNFMKKSQYDTDDNGRVDKADTAYSVHGPTSYEALLKNTTADTYLLTEEDKGKRGGVVPLDTNRKILPEFLPDSITAGLTYGGIFNAQTRVVRLTPAAKSILGVSTDTMTLQNSSVVPEGYPANAELFYITTVADTFASMVFAVGDWLISLGTEWQQLKNGAAVSAVNNKTGAVSLNSDDIPQGTDNLYMTVAERSKLMNIENAATRDVNVVQQAEITTLPSGTRVLRLTNKNGNVVDFEGASVDMTEYLKTNGNASQTFVMYTQGGARQSFNGSETLALFHKKVVDYLNALEAVAFSGSYNDLADKPTRTSAFINDGQGSGAYVTAQANNMANYYLKTQTYTKTEIDNLIAAIEGLKFIKVNELPTTNIDDSAIYYVPITGETGYTRWQHMSNEWLNLGTTDIDMTEYLKKDGDGSTLTLTFTMADARAPLATGDTMAEIIGSLARWVYDLKDICFTASWHDLVDANELATQEDLEDYVLKHYTPADEGKVLAIDSAGDVTLQTLSAGVMRRGLGANSVIGNDTVEDPKNYADGSGATALGTYTVASGQDQLAYGHNNVEDTAGNFVEVVGGGSPTDPLNIKTTDWFGNGWYRGKVSVGNNTDNIVNPTQGNDLTPKNYVDNIVDTKIAEANLLKSMVVTELPDVEDADANILYLIEDPTQAETYLTYKKVLESQDPDVWIMASIGSTQVSTSDIQVAELPTPSVAFNNAVYQYIGTSSEYHYGRFYACKSKTFYGWLANSSAVTYYTDTPNPVHYDKIYRANGVVTGNWVYSASTTTMTDNAGNNYTRLANADYSEYMWTEIDNKLSDYVNDGTGTGAPDDYYLTKANADTIYNPNLTAGTAISTVTDTTKISQVDLANDKVADMSALNVFQYIAKKIYPVGAIYMSVDNTSPATLFGGTWTKLENRFLIGASTTYPVNSTGGSSTVKLTRANLPNTSVTTDSKGLKKLDIFHGVKAFTYKGGGEPNKWGLDYGTKELYESNSLGKQIETASSHAHTFNLNGGVAQTSVDKMPPYLAVNMWKRTS